MPRSYLVFKWAVYALATALLAHSLTRWDREQNAGCAGEKNMV